MTSKITEQFNMLLKRLQSNYNVLMVEGVRGVGKSSFCNTLLRHTDADMYKTWGANQRTNREQYTSLGLDLPQGTYFVLDYLAQVRPEKPVLVDRCILSALAYQRDRFLSRKDLHEYYVGLMRDAGACILYLECSVGLVYRRRRWRVDDEMRSLGDEALEAECFRDKNLYDDAVRAMLDAGLHSIGKYSVSTEVTATLLGAKSL